MRRLAILLAGCVAAFTFPAATQSAADSEAHIAFKDTLSNPCTGEMVVVTGEMHMVMNESQTHDYLLVNWQNVRGVALVTGTKYQANDASNLYVRQKGSGETVGFRQEFELVSLDNTPNFLVHELVEVTFPSFDVRMRGGSKCSGPTPDP